MTSLSLSAVEARVLAALVEKSITTPQYYPLTVNAAALAANQKNARNPLMNLSEGEAGAALTRLEQLGLSARDDHAGRVPKWRQRMAHQLLLKPHALAVLTALILRGPQTLAELRANAAPLGGPADESEVAAALADLADRAQPLVITLSRAAGQKEARHAHLLSGTPVVAPSSASATGAPPHAPRPSATDLHEQVQKLEARVAELERQLASLGDIGAEP